jgi:thioredoxin-related protein
MKKLMIVAAAMLSAAALFTGCGKSAKADEFGWYHDYDDAKKVAQKQNKEMLIFVSMDGDDENSKTIKEKVFNTKEFAGTIGKKFVPVNLDFSQKSYAKTTAPQGATDKEQKAADAYAAKLKKDMAVATMYNVKMTPAVYIATKDGYYVSFIDYDATLDTAEAYAKMLDDKNAEIKIVNDMVAATKKGSNTEKVKAIDALYEATDSSYRPLLADIYRKVPDLDKKNESGLVSKYILATANADAISLYGAGDYPAAAKKFADAGANAKISKEDKQQAYYTAGYLLGSTGSTDYAVITGYLQSAYDADPESEHAAMIKQTMEYVKSLMPAPDASAPADNKKTETDKKTK